MSTVINETKPRDKVSKNTLNRRRWSTYAKRLEKITADPKQAYRALMILMGSINAKERWVRIKEEEFLQLIPSWSVDTVETDWVIPCENHEVKLHSYYNVRAEKYYFSRLMVRSDQVHVLSGWHVATLNGVRSRGITMTQELSDELYLIGDWIVKSIRSEEGIWRKPLHSMLSTLPVTEEEA